MLYIKQELFLSVASFKARRNDGIYGYDKPFVSGFCNSSDYAIMQKWLPKLRRL